MSPLTHLLLCPPTPTHICYSPLSQGKWDFTWLLQCDHVGVYEKCKLVCNTLSSPPVTQAWRDLLVFSDVSLATYINLLEEMKNLLWCIFDVYVMSGSFTAFLSLPPNVVWLGLLSIRYLSFSPSLSLSIYLPSFHVCLFFVFSTPVTLSLSFSHCSFFLSISLSLSPYFSFRQSFLLQPSFFVHPPFSTFSTPLIFLPLFSSLPWCSIVCSSYRGYHRHSIKSPFLSADVDRVWRRRSVRVEIPENKMPARLQGALLSPRGWKFNFSRALKTAIMQSKD